MRSDVVGEGARRIAGPEVGASGVERREFLKGLVALGAGGLLAATLGTGGRASAAGTMSSAFPDGVKSGDPLPDGSVIWTRVPAPLDGAPVPVLWLVYEDESERRVVRGGIEQVDDRLGHACRVRVRGLRPDRWYHYVFHAQGGHTISGRLRTAPLPGATPDRLRYAFASCQQRTASRYVAHRAIANDDVDFLMHLGDYIYVSDTGDTTLDRYRDRWRIFHSNPLLQELHARVPLVAMWDDGEFYNGVDRTGPPERLEAAKRAWFEHMPLEPGPDFRSYRRFSWGRLGEVFMIDVRSYRDPEVPANVPPLIPGIDPLAGQDSSLPSGRAMFEPGRTTLGAEQQRWLERSLRRSRAAWKFIGNPYNMNPWKLVDRSDTEGAGEGVYISNEAWDDYQAERREFLAFVDRARIENVVVTSGHTHFYLASELQPQHDDPTSPVVAFDFVTGSLTADPDPRTIAPITVLRIGEAIMRDNNAPYLKHVDLVEQGYALVDVTPEEAIVEFRGIDTFDENAEPYTFARFRVRDGSRELETLPV